MSPCTTDTTVEPSSFAELLDQVQGLSGVTYTGDPRQTLNLDRRCSGRRKTWARKAWRALSALESYALARSKGAATAGFWHYCQSGAAPISHHQVSLQESSHSMQRWAGERLFPVPSWVHPQRVARMVAHIRIDNRAPAPRIYYLDRTSMGEGVLVGYIGAHLTTSRT